MRELVRTNDPVLISFIVALLKDAEIAHTVLDANMSVMEGSVGILQRRVIVAEDDYQHARRILRDADIAHELRPDNKP